MTRHHPLSTMSVEEESVLRRRSLTDCGLPLLQGVGLGGGDEGQQGQGQGQLAGHRAATPRYVTVLQLYR